MAYFDKFYHNIFNTICLKYAIVLHTQVLNVICFQMLLYLVKIVNTLYINIISYISRTLLILKLVYHTLYELSILKLT